MGTPMALKRRNGAGLGFPIGFVIFTAALHGTGLLLGLAALRFNRPKLYGPWAAM